jgi:hypothetical protein
MKMRLTKLVSCLTCGQRLPDKCICKVSRHEKLRRYVAGVKREIKAIDIVLNGGSLEIELLGERRTAKIEIISPFHIDASHEFRFNLEKNIVNVPYVLRNGREIVYRRFLDAVDPETKTVSIHWNLEIGTP